MPAPGFVPHVSEPEFAAQVRKAVDEVARRAAGQLCAAGRAGDPVPTDRVRALAHLYVLVTMEEAVQHLERGAARAAADAGAGYPEIGQVSRMSRQGARRRWPGLVTDPASSPSHQPTRSS
ncbi:hypothetical protein [Streptomyces adustus]|uniref:hypothetical protein n=1 Tax=Streptomyces adustus TaxID=1609272 RepID=UPI003710EF43